MPHADERDDYDDLPPDPRPRSGPAVPILLILGGLAVVFLVVCGGAFALFWMRVAPVAPPVPAAGPVANAGPGAGGTRRVYDRDEFKRLVLGADPNRVRELVGPPAGVEEHERTVWHVAGRTRDPATGLVDQDAIVVFKDGKVEEVRFTPA